MTITRVGANSDYSANFDAAFGKKKKAKKTTAKKATATKKKTPKKKAGKK